MNNGMEQQDFDTVSAAFLNDWALHRAQMLLEYMDRYPDYAADLMLLAVEIESAEKEQFPLETPPTALLERLLVDTRAILAPVSNPLIGGLRDFARTHRGLVPRDLASQLLIGQDVLIEIDEGGVIPTSIPMVFTHKVAAALDLPVETIHGHFLGRRYGPAGGVAYHAPQGHQVPSACTFMDLIEQSDLTSDEQKAFWRAQTTPEPQAGF